MSPESGKLATDLGSQVQQALHNLDEVLKAGDSSKDRVVKTTCFLKNMSDFKAMNGIYEAVSRPQKNAHRTTG